MVEPPVHHFAGRDGVELAYRERGEGRPVLLLHGFFSLAARQWLDTGHAAAIAASGNRVIMPDLRGHGDSSRPHDPSRYPPDVLTDDAFALVDHLGLTDYDLGGYSLGGRIVVRMLVRGATPGRAIVAGQGLDAVTGAGGGVGTLLRRVFTNLGTFEHGTAEWKAEQWLRSVDGDPVALVGVLDSVVATPVEEIARIDVPALVVVGADDSHVRSSAALAHALPHGRHALVPGDHTEAITWPEIGAAMAEFLSRGHES